MTEHTITLDEQRQALLENAPVDSRVAEGLTAFHVAMSRVPAPNAFIFAPVRFSTSSNAR